MQIDIFFWKFNSIKLSGWWSHPFKASRNSNYSAPL